MGAPAKSGRIAFGALVVKEQLGISDEETRPANRGEPISAILPGLARISANRSVRLVHEGAFSQSL